MNDFDHDHSALVTSIKASGQLVPVLLRPHPQEKGRYQTAYGHRRVRALAELGLPVRAVVRDLSDNELIVAQGKENSDRRDLSFIERASYALALEDRGFGRDVIMSALGVDKTELSRLISISKALPGDLVRAIGPAPKAGRRRWSELAEKLSGRQSEKVIQETMSLNRFKSSGTDERFALLLGALATPKPKHLSTPWSSDDGKTGVVQIDRRSEKTILAVDETKAPMFGEFLISRLPELYQAFRTERGIE
jgi:ParB family chromosome partitioning protein